MIINFSSCIFNKKTTPHQLHQSQNSSHATLTNMKNIQTNPSSKPHHIRICFTNKTRPNQITSHLRVHLYRHCIHFEWENYTRFNAHTKKLCEWRIEFNVGSVGCNCNPNTNTSQISFNPQ